MNESSHLGIDFTEAKPIADFPENILAIAQNEATRLENIWGFSAPSQDNTLSGPCALGTVFYFHSIGWSHLPKEQNGRPVNDPYIEALMQWSETPNLLTEKLGTTPNVMLATLRKAGLKAEWYAGNTVDKTLQLINYELALGQPVIVLINHGSRGQPLSLEWQVVFKMTSSTVHTKHCAYADAEKAWAIDTFSQCLHMDLPALGCNVITAEKEQ